MTKKGPFATVALAMLVWFGSPSEARAQLGIYDETAFSASVGSGARALGMGGAFLAIADDSSAAAWNPAGIGVPEKPEASLVWRPIRNFKGDTPNATATFNTPFGAGVEKDTGYIYSLKGQAVEFASASIPFRVGSVKLVPQFSFQRAVDLGGNWDQAASTSTTTIGGKQTQTLNFASSSGKFTGGIDVYSGSLGVSFNQHLYLGVAVNKWTNGVTGVNGEEQKYEGTNVNFGAIVSPIDKVRIGLVFKTPFTMTQTAKENVADLGLTTFNNKIRWPKTIGGGMAFLPSEALTLSVDFTETKWSESTITFQGGDSRQWQGPLDGKQLRFGAEYVIKSPRVLGPVVIALRAGAFNDRQFYEGDSSYLGLTGGLGLVWSRLVLDMAYLHEAGDHKYSTQNSSDFTQTFDRAEKVSVDKLYVSTTVRF